MEYEQMHLHFVFELPTLSGNAKKNDYVEPLRSHASLMLNTID